MTTEAFVYWLQGFLEMSDPKTLNETQTEMLKQHLNLVFTNVTNIESKNELRKIPNVPPVDREKLNEGADIKIDDLLKKLVDDDAEIQKERIANWKSYCTSHALPYIKCKQNNSQLFC